MDESVDIVIRDIQLKDSITRKKYLKELITKYLDNLLLNKDFLIKTYPFLASYFFPENIKRINEFDVDISYSEKENEYIPFSRIHFHKVFKIVDKPVRVAKTNPLLILNVDFFSVIQCAAKEIFLDIITTTNFHCLFIHKLRFIYDKKNECARFQIFYYFLRIEDGFVSKNVFLF